MISQIEKTPRWFLVLLTTVAIMMGWGAVGLLVRTAFADMAEVRKIANTAKSESSQNTNDIVFLKETINKIAVSQETYRKEYREDQTNLSAKLDRLLYKVS